jgi:hypothetical protein
MATRTLVLSTQTGSIVSWQADRDYTIVAAWVGNSGGAVSFDPTLTYASASTTEGALFDAVIVIAITMSFLPLNVPLPKGTKLYFAPRSAASYVGLLLDDTVTTV